MELRRPLDVAASRLGYVRRRPPPFPFDVDTRTAQQLSVVEPFTRVPVSGLLAVQSALQQLERTKVSGAIVECGVWRGGAMMLAALTLLALDEPERELWLYDTFQGMDTPSDVDQRFDGTSAAEMLHRADRFDPRSVWCVADRQDVQRNMASTNYPPNRLRFVEGKIEDTVPREVPVSIALLRIDVDWYEPTRHALEHLVPLVEYGGFVLLDDYGYWQGARRAIDEYLATLAPMPYLHRVDETNRLFIVAPA